MKVPPPALTLLMGLSSCLALIRPPGYQGLPGAPSVAPAPPAPPAPPGTIPHGPNLWNCAPGDLIPGPTCTSFFMCLGSNKYATRRVKFECALGTAFHSGVGTCVFYSQSQCLTPVVGPPAPPPTNPPAPVGPAQTTLCKRYQMDPTTVYECLSEGFFPYLSDCARFYKCVVTMGCTIKGFLFSCPDGYVFDRRQQECAAEDEAGQLCERVQLDSVQQTHDIRPIVQLQQESLDDFFQADIYWDLMPYLPNDTQRLVPIIPPSFSRAPNEGVFMPFV